MNIWAIILAAGSSTRLATAGLNRPKQFMLYQDRPLFWHSALTFSRLPAVKGLIFVFPPIIPLVDGATSFNEHFGQIIHELNARDNLGLIYKLAQGGATRQDSVYAGLQELPAESQEVLVHDSARPFASATLCARIIDGLRQGYKAVIPGLAVTDTIKEVDEDSFVNATPKRSSLFAIQTPQAFNKETLKEAHKKAQEDNFIGTDDASLVERIGTKVFLVSGEAKNIKITQPQDLELLEEKKSSSLPYTCMGYDVHKYGGNRPLILGGVPIECNISIEAHSDGDVLLHALADALLASMGSDSGDIGSLFPDNDPKYDNYSSGAIVAEVLHETLKHGIKIHHVDMTLVAQTPRIGPHRKNIARNVAKILHLQPEEVSLKATTEEKMGFTGEKKGIKAMVCLSVSRN